MDGEYNAHTRLAMRFVLLTDKGKRLPFNYSITSPGNYKPCKIKLEQEQQKQQQATFQRWVQKDTSPGRSHDPAGGGREHKFVASKKGRRTF